MDGTEASVEPGADLGLFLEEISRGSVSPYEEMVASECLYAMDGMTLKRVSEATVKEGKLPSRALADAFGLIDPTGTELYGNVESYIGPKLGTFGIAVNMTPSWPAMLADAERSSPVLYYRGDVNLTDAVSVSVVGSRKASREGMELAAEYADAFCRKGVTVVTGLAEGIDTAATEAALATGNPVVGVIGTPIDEVYPRKNAALHGRVVEQGLLLSQVPFYKYSVQPFNTKRFYFPERNELMAAVSNATLIVEASDTSGTLTQARACLHQGRPLFITRRCFEDPSLTWPKKYAGRNGVAVVDGPEEVIEVVSAWGEVDRP